MTSGPPAREAAASSAGPHDNWGLGASAATADTTFFPV